MNAVYKNITIEPSPGRAVRASFDIENTSQIAWRTSEGFAVGYHIFDPETGTLVVDGAREPLAPGLEPGQAAHVEISVELPPEPGRYRIYVSPMRENVTWFYQDGWRFLLIDAVVEADRVVLERSQSATAAVVRRERWLRSIRRAFTLPLATVWRHRALIRSMVRRDILGRYRGSFAGIFWTVLNPLMLMVTYFFVFGVVLRARFGADPSRSGFVLYFLAGMLPWLPLSEAAGRAPFVMLDHRNFVKKLVFPVEILPVNLVVSGLVSQAFALVLFLFGLLLARGTLPLSVIWLPVVLIPQILFTAGVCWVLAALGVFVRDLGQMIGFLLTLWFFLTPICYAETQLPAAATPILSKNPMFVLVRGYRAIFLESQAPGLAPMWKLWLVSATVAVAGHAWFYKLRKSFPDVI